MLVVNWLPPVTTSSDLARTLSNGRWGGPISDEIRTQVDWQCEGNCKIFVTTLMISEYEGVLHLVRNMLNTTMETICWVRVMRPFHRTEFIYDFSTAACDRLKHSSLVQLLKLQLPLLPFLDSEATKGWQMNWLQSWPKYRWSDEGWRRTLQTVNWSGALLNNDGTVNQFCLNFR